VVTHTYPDLGTYVAVVTATNSINAITATTQVTVTDRTISGLTAANDGPMELERTTTLTAAVSAGSNVSYAWAFGDGATGNGAVVTHTYNSVGIHAAVVTATNSVSADTTTTDVSITEAPPVVITYTYDPLNRLTGASYSTGESYAYQYDGVRNRMAMTDTTGTTAYTYDDANRLASVGGVTYTWDDRGNLRSDGVFTNTYSAAGRMVRAESVTATL
jgi:YD repeat-containing protein